MSLRRIQADNLIAKKAAERIQSIKRINKKSKTRGMALKPAECTTLFAKEKEFDASVTLKKFYLSVEMEGIYEQRSKEQRSKNQRIRMIFR